MMSMYRINSVKIDRTYAPHVAWHGTMSDGNIYTTHFRVEPVTDINEC